jgi:hypothetical protein
MTTIEKDTFISPKKTFVNNGKYWICANVPCKVITVDDKKVCYEPFNSKRKYYDNIEFVKETFENVNSDKEYVYTDYYPDKKIAISEFDVKLPIIEKKKCLDILKKNKTPPSIITMVEKAYQDSYNSKGSTFCINIKIYNDFISGKKKLTALEQIGDPIFNRNSRHTLPIYNTYTQEEFKKNKSYPAPIGIRYEDFALPTEQNLIFKDLIKQIFSSKNCSELPIELKTILDISIEKNTHKCDWCGELVDFNDINQNYCSKEHSINFCHKDPCIGTKKGNIYLGHCSCNREQGGYSEIERVKQVIRFLKASPDILTQDMKEDLLQILSK